MKHSEFAAKVTTKAQELLTYQADVSDEIFSCALIEAVCDIALNKGKQEMLGEKLCQIGLLLQAEIVHAPSSR